MCNMALDYANDFQVVINSLLCQDRDLVPHFLPIDFTETKEATKRNVRSKQLAGKALADGVPLILFPSGHVSTADAPGFGDVVDHQWTTFIAKLVMQYQPTVVPVYFHGQNTRLFHVASNIAEPFRMAMHMRRSTQALRVNCFTRCRRTPLARRLRAYPKPSGDDATFLRYRAEHTATSIRREQVAQEHPTRVENCDPATGKGR